VLPCCCIAPHMLFHFFVFQAKALG
jgi:hypothetical protein